jgi:hypothetical protein
VTFRFLQRRRIFHSFVDTVTLPLFGSSVHPHLNDLKLCGSRGFVAAVIRARLFGTVDARTGRNCQGDRRMADNQLLAALLTVALNSTKPRAASKKMGAEQWGNVWSDYNKFFKKLEKADASIDKRGINPD